MLQNAYANIDGDLVRGVQAPDGYRVETFDPEKGEFVLTMDRLDDLFFPAQTGVSPEYRTLTKEEFDLQVSRLRSS